MKNVDEAKTHTSDTCGEMINFDEAESHVSGTMAGGDIAISK